MQYFGLYGYEWQYCLWHTSGFETYQDCITVLHCEVTLIKNLIKELERKMLTRVLYIIIARQLRQSQKAEKPVGFQWRALEEFSCGLRIVYGVASEIIRD